MKTATVFGAGGFIGNAMVSRLKSEGYWVRGVDLKYPEFNETKANDFIIGDLREFNIVYESLFKPTNLSGDLCVDELYQFAADMGGADYIFTGEHDADIMSNSAAININTCLALRGEYVHKRIKCFYSSSACMYPQDIQHEVDSPALAEYMAYPGNPDSEYGWEKLFSERLYKSYERNYGLSIRIARFHNIFGAFSCYNNGKEKYPAAICRKVAEAKNGESIIIWGDGKATRSFLHVDECLEGIRLLMQSCFADPINIGSSEQISVEDLAKMVISISGKDLKIEHDLNKPQGVRGRNSDNSLCKEILGWSPSQLLREGMTKTYNWVNQQVNQ